MASLEELEARVNVLEEQVRHTRQDAAAARVLAGAADRDVSEMKQVLGGHTKVLNAVRETQVEHGQQLGSLDSRVGSLEAKVDSGFTKVNISMDRVAQLLQQVIDKG
jgi:BMFP domain-containing protein YqiC